MATAKEIVAAIHARHQAIFVGVVADAQASIAFGSSITGAPGQPVEDKGPDKGNLRASWTQGPEFITPTHARIGTNCEYAESNEDGIARPGGGAYVLRAHIGGRHSVKLTVTNIDKIVADVSRKLGPDGGASGAVTPSPAAPTPSVAGASI